MFADLMDPDIQPGKIKAELIPEIEISESLKLKLKKMFDEEENAYSKVADTTSIVQTEKNYVFFSNQWLYLAVMCKKYAQELYRYCDFFDNKMKSSAKVMNCVKSQNYTSPEFAKFFESNDDKERMIKFIVGDTDFRPGKNLINSGDKIRSCKDVFGSCILGKLEVPNASSAYLGNLVYYLAKRPDLFDALNREVMNQMSVTDSVTKLPSGVKDCAKAIIDCAYKFDSFELLKPLLEANDKNIKVNTSQMDGVIATGNFLRYIFVRPSSNLYDTIKGDKPRVFTDKEYEIDLIGVKEKCRLTTEWVDSAIDTSGNGNYLKALIEVINNRYSEIFEIIEEDGDRYLVMLKTEFKLKDMPDIFKTDFSRRFITSLLAKPFVILTGNSGTGKTKIAKQFAEYLERIDEDGKTNWALVPVGADWTDNTKILGFCNPLANEGKGEYVNTNILELIERANTKKNIPYFLILDEMNLSHVERYFADFLSHMETPEISFNLDGYDGKLKFPANLFVVGTVNIDETTYMFSPKVLDRANVVEFKPEEDSVLRLFTEPAGSKKMVAANDGTVEAFLKLSYEIRAGKCEIESEMLGIQKHFKQIYEITAKCGYEFAYRTVKEIRRYISAAYEIEDEAGFNILTVEDEQLLQKILPKIHGNKKEIGDLLNELGQFSEEAKFKLSGEKIEQMKGKLAKVQYASFI